jgi:hypothetical protein
LQVLLCNPQLSFVTAADVYIPDSDVQLQSLLTAMAHSLLGSPAAAISSDQALDDFCKKFPKRFSPNLWKTYIDKFDKDFVRLLHKMLHRPGHADLGCCFLHDKTVHILCGGEQGLSAFSGSELQELLLPVLRRVRASKTLISAIVAMVDMDAKRLHERRLRKQLEQQQQQQQQQHGRRGRERDLKNEDAENAALQRRRRRRL